MLANRWVFVDLFRFSAVLLMVQGHVFDASLSPAVKAMGWFEWHQFVHGFTAPMFLFSSGLAFGVATFRKWDSHTKPSLAVWKRIRRYGLLFLIGYWLHLPFPSLVRVLTESSPSQLSTFFKVDALQIIAFTLISAQLLVLVTRRRDVFIAVLGFVAAVIWSVTPAVWSGNYSEWPEFIVAYLHRNTGSYFPIFPWSIYLLAGTMTSYYFFTHTNTSRLTTIYLPLLVGAIVLITLGLLGTSSIIYIFSNNNYIVFIVVLRIGLIICFLLLLFGFDLWLRKRRTQPEHAQRGFSLQTCIVMGQETLAIYVVHLLIVYGSVVNQRFLPEARQSLDLLGSSLYAVLLLIAMAIFGWGWHLLKTERPQYFQAFQYSGTALIIVFFVLNGWLI